MRCRWSWCRPESGAWSRASKGGQKTRRPTLSSPASTPPCCSVVLTWWRSQPEVSCATRRRRCAPSLAFRPGTSYKRDTERCWWKCRNARPSAELCPMPRSWFSVFGFLDKYYDVPGTTLIPSICLVWRQRFIWNAWVFCDLFQTQKNNTYHSKDVSTLLRVILENVVVVAALLEPSLWKNCASIACVTSELRLRHFRSCFEWIFSEFGGNSLNRQARLLPLLFVESAEKCRSAWEVARGRRKDFLQGRANSGFFQVVVKKDFPGWGAKSGEISFYPLETKKSTFYWKLYRKMSNLKIQGGPRSPCHPLPMPMSTTWVLWIHQMTAIIKTCHKNTCWRHVQKLSQKRLSTSRFRIIVFNIEVPITPGFPVELHYKAVSEPAVVRRLVSQLHKSTGEVVAKKPKFISKVGAFVNVRLFFNYYFIKAALRFWRQHCRAGLHNIRATCVPREPFLLRERALSIAENVAKVRLRITINNRTKCSLAASFWRVCLLVPGFIRVFWR